MSYENNFEAVIDLDNKLKNKIYRSQNARY